LGCILPNVALAQFKIETGHFKSAICKENKNIAGIRNSASPLSVGKNRGHNVYKTYRDCLKDYVRIQNKYLKAIDGRYAEAEGYTEQLKKVK
jgi:flagellum-specific peptidoglycan hydrolase FlgJ